MDTINLLTKKHTKTNGDRFIFVDALRGIAAFMVLLDHLFFNHNTPILHRLPLGSYFPSLIMHGTLGVQIFFVLSGFVIAHSLRNVTLNSREVFNFILRRQIRLDPPYWTILLVSLILQRMKSLVSSASNPAMPSLLNIALNATYLNDFFNVEKLIDVAWTLCIEVQFYLAFIILLMGVQHQVRKSDRELFTRKAGLTIWLSGLFSLAYTGWKFGGDSQGPFFLAYWFYFVSGVLSYWAFQQKISAFYLWSFALALSIFTLFFFKVELVENLNVTTMTRIVSARPLMGLAVMLTLYLVGNAGHLSHWLGSKSLQFLGKISYSLYLVHVIVLSLVIRIGYKLTGDNPVAAIVWLFIAGAASILVGYIFHLAVEKPSMRLASRLKIHSDSSL